MSEHLFDLFRLKLLADLAPEYLDYGELYQLRKDVKTLIKNNDGLKSTLETMLDQLANLSLLLSAQRYSPLPMLLPEEHLLQSLPVAEVAATPIPTLVLMAK